MDIPTDIIEAAQKVENWMKRNGHNRWELLGLCSRDHAAELKMWREGGLTEEVLRRNDGYIKVGKGCAIVRADELEMERDELRRRVEVAEEMANVLKACHDSWHTIGNIKHQCAGIGFCTVESAIAEWKEANK